jgi:uncharacterized membrane protein YidH (DUF202 family)
MRKSAVVIPLLALIAGGLGLMIRQMELNTAFEASTGFAKRGEPITAVLIAVSAAVVVLAAVAGIIISRRMKTADDYSVVFATKSPAYLAISMFLGIVWLAADILYFFDMFGSYTRAATESGMAVGFPILDIIFVFLAAVSAVSIIFLARGAFKGRGGTEMMIFSVIPSVFFSFWLILLYKNNAANPVILRYAYECLAIVAAALSSYFSAGFVYRKAAAGRMLFSFLVTIYFCTVVLVDNIGLPLKLIFGVTVIGAFINCIVFIKNLCRKDDA